jgi:hypothetical protein
VSIDWRSLRRTPGVSDAIGEDEVVGDGEERNSYWSSWRNGDGKVGRRSISGEKN